MFLEKLPTKCPPDDAIDRELKNVYRLLKTDKPDGDSFKSHAALGKKCPAHVEPCRWSSCSLVADPFVLKKMPQFKKFHWAAKMDIPKGAGQSKGSIKKNHFDFWSFKSFDFNSAVVKVSVLLD